MEKQLEERLDKALRHPDSTLKRVCNGYLQDASVEVEKAKNLKEAIALTDLFKDEELKRLQGNYENSKLQALTALKFVHDRKFGDEARQKFEELDKVFSEKKDG